MPPTEAESMFNQFLGMLKESHTVATGRFGASMDVQIQNLGPVTFCLDF